MHLGMERRRWEMSVESAIEDGQEEESGGGEAREDGEEPELHVTVADHFYNVLVQMNRVTV